MRAGICSLEVHHRRRDSRKCLASRAESVALVFCIDVGVLPHGVAIDHVPCRAGIDGVLQSVRLESGGGKVDATTMGEDSVGPGGWLLSAAILRHTESWDGRRKESQCCSETC